MMIFFRVLKSYHTLSYLWQKRTLSASLPAAQEDLHAAIRGHSSPKVAEDPWVRLTPDLTRGFPNIGGNFLGGSP